MKRIEELTLKLLDGDLAGEEKEELDRLAASDPGAARTQLSLFRLEALLRGSRADLDVTDATMRALKAELEKRMERGVMNVIRQAAPLRPVRCPRKTSGWRYWPFLPAAAALVAAILLALPSERPTEEKTPPSKAFVQRPAPPQEPPSPERGREEEKKLDAKQPGMEPEPQEMPRREEELSRPAVQPGQDLGEREKRKDEERRPAGEQERVEPDKETVRQAPSEPPQEEPVRPSEPPKAPPTTAIIPIIATVERAEGDTSLVGKEGKFQARAGQGVLEGQGVETGAKSALVMKYPDGTRLVVGAGSLLLELKGEGGKRLRMEKGSVHATVPRQPKNQPMSFLTPQGEVKLLGTKLRLRVDPGPKGATRLYVEEGKVEFKTPAGMTMLVEGGQFAAASAEMEPAARKIPPGLAACWTFEERAGPMAWDWSGNGNDAWMEAAARVQEKGNGFADFRPPGSVLVVPEAPDLFPRLITLAAWIKPEVAFAGMKSHPTIFQIEDFEAKKGYFLGILASASNRIGFRFHADSGSFLVTYDEAEWGKWIHVAATYDGAYLRLYRNGVEKASQKVGVLSLRPGGKRLTMGWNLQGWLDDLRVYGRALKTEEIRALAARPPS